MDNIGIEVVAVAPEQGVTKKGEGYEFLNLIFKNLNFNKVEQKKIMPFGASRGVKDALEGAAVGSQWTVTRVKDNNGYWQWNEIQAGANMAETPKTTTQASGKTLPAYTRDFETREERLKRQVLIVRQSSLTAAINTLIVGPAKVLKPEDVMGLAEKYTQWVFEAENVEVESPTTEN